MAGLLRPADPRNDSTVASAAPVDSASPVDDASSANDDATDRGAAPVVAVALLVACTVALSAVVGATALSAEPTDPPPVASIDLAVDGDTLTFTHRGGDALDAREIRIVVAVDGRPLDRQPSVPFFSRRGFRSAPTGPFNPAADPRWTAGETAAFAVAGTNRPRVRAGAVVEASLFVGDHRMAVLRTSAA
ncbi:type IV pilin N-terminal domain-containing protein [Halobaculum sp. CBA1158]|uniref:type IV pilin n=1 Tax=Halobaculum sp. CBA1158 TaxID=2904243 RepID=UPI001F46730F|nr:type IV pilin N-terminal domain-containing protein [Halobaculum sp. CBA1158]UIP00715.1 type IV pilin N-terminal domain-containing protein [Halobaculum sp. CBA1158]